MYTSIRWYLRVLRVLYRPDVEDVGVNIIFSIGIKWEDSK